jgi:hypothetical protein
MGILADKSLVILQMGMHIRPLANEIIATCEVKPKAMKSEPRQALQRGLLVATFLQGRGQMVRWEYITGTSSMALETLGIMISHGMSEIYPWLDLLISPWFSGHSSHFLRFY